MSSFRRVRPGTRAEVGWFVWTLSTVAARRQRTGPPNLFLTLGRHRRLALGWLVFAAQLMPGGRLPRRDTELVILRVAERCRCDYEREHHRHLGRLAGLSLAEIDGTHLAPDDERWSARQRALLAFVDQLLEDGDVDDERWRAAAVHLGDRQMIELCMLVGHYAMLASTIRVLRVQPDTELADAVVDARVPAPTAEAR